MLLLPAASSMPSSSPVRPRPARFMPNFLGRRAVEPTSKPLDWLKQDYNTTLVSVAKKHNNNNNNNNNNKTKGQDALDAHIDRFTCDVRKVPPGSANRPVMREYKADHQSDELPRDHVAGHRNAREIRVEHRSATDGHENVTV